MRNTRDLRRFRLSEEHQAAGVAVAEIGYHALPVPPETEPPTPQKRCVEHVRMLYFGDDLAGPLAFGQVGRLGLPYETYKLALTDDLLTAVLGGKLEDLRSAGESRQAMLVRVLREGGYYRFAAEPNRWWVRSGIAGFEPDAADHFYLPERYTDPFNQTTTLVYDEGYDLYLCSSTDPVGNITEVTRFDFRVLAPAEMRDLNGNLSEVAFDTLGMPAAMATKGKGSEGDTLERVPVDLDAATVIRFFAGDYDEYAARALLGSATARHLYYLGEQQTEGDDVTYGHHPACAAGLVREMHVALGGDYSALQAGFEYSDGTGQALMAKAKAEGGPVLVREGDGPVERMLPLRWIATGKTILNNKGKPVKQYEPYFSAHAHWDAEEASQASGVTPVMYYDAAGRLVRTEAPDGSCSRVAFSPWHVASYDANDTVLEAGNGWYAKCDPLDPSRPIPIDGLTLEPLATPSQRAAWLAAQHAGTPAVTALDSLGRDVVAIAHNRTPDAGGVWHDERYVTFTKLDAEGKPLWIRDDRGNRVMEYITTPGAVTGYVPCYDIAGNLLYQHSMDAGDRLMLADSTGQPFYAWDENERAVEGGSLVLERRLYHTAYDALRRPLAQQLQINGGAAQVVERFTYGDLPGLFAERPAEATPEAQERNLRGQPFQHYDPSGLLTNQRYDFKGNLCETARQLARDYQAHVLDWTAPAEGDLGDTYVQITEYDALNRMTRLYNWHRGPDSPVAVYVPSYNARGLLEGEDLLVGAIKTATSYEVVRPRPGTEPYGRIHAITAIEYNAKGQRTYIELGNGTATRYHYDSQTFRLAQLRTARPSPGAALPSPPSNLDDENALQNLYYTYDPAGNITEIHDDAYEPVFFRNQEVRPRSLYTYDALYRLIDASGRENARVTGAPGQFEEAPQRVSFDIRDSVLRKYTQYYTYDAAGNFRQMRHVADGGSWTRYYETSPDSNRLLRTWEGAEKWEDSALDTRVVYDYDIHGSMLTIANVPPGQFLRWDYRDMILRLNLEGGGWAYYSYDSDKQRTRKRIERDGATVEERLYLGGMELYRRWRGDTLVEEIETHHLFVDDQRVLLVEDVLRTDNTALPEGVLCRYQFGNHLGSVGLELDAKAQIISYEECHPYGTSAYRANNADLQAAAKRYRYTGMERDEESGLSYHTARYYLSWLGRWGSADPIGISDGMNRYSYCSSNPCSQIDSKGTQSRSVLAQRITARHPLLGSDFAERLSPSRPRLDPSLLAAVPFAGAGLLLPSRNPYDASTSGYAPAREILAELPDGSAYIGPADRFPRVAAQMRFEMAMQTLAAAQSTTGLGALLGYTLYGEEGARAGIAAEGLAFSGTLVYAGVQARSQTQAYRGGPSFPNIHPPPYTETPEPLVEPEPPVVGHATSEPMREIPVQLEIDLIAQARAFYALPTAPTSSISTIVGVLIVEGEGPMAIRSGVDGGPWGGTQRGGIPRGQGYGFTSGGPSQGNIATHVEGHSAAIMHQRGIRSATLIIERDPCDVCSRDLMSALPAGSTLTVISPSDTTVFRSSQIP